MWLFSLSLKSCMRFLLAHKHWDIFWLPAGVSKMCTLKWTGQRFLNSLKCEWKSQTISDKKGKENLSSEIRQLHMKVKQQRWFSPQFLRKNAVVYFEKSVKSLIFYFFFIFLSSFVHHWIGPSLVPPDPMYVLHFLPVLYWIQNREKITPIFFLEPT